MLAVDGQQRGAPLAHGLHEKRAPDNQRFLVGKKQTLASLGRGHARLQAGSADDGRHHRVDFRVRRDERKRVSTLQHLGGHVGRTQPVAQKLGLGRLRHHRKTRPPLQALREELVDAAVRTERKYFVAPGVT